MKTFYEFFLIFVIILKFIYLIVVIGLFLYKYSNKQINYQDNKIIIFSNKLKIFTQLIMFGLLIVIFRPWLKTGNPTNLVYINHHERIIFFALGIIGLLETDWRYLFKKNDLIPDNNK